MIRLTLAGRTKVTHAGAAAQGGKTGGSAQGTSKALTTFIDPSLNWDDVTWFKSITGMKIVLKGVVGEPF
jgi:L-lactate dehydrogenase (cytochrome)